MKITYCCVRLQGGCACSGVSQVVNIFYRSTISVIDKNLNVTTYVRNEMLSMMSAMSEWKVKRNVKSPLQLYWPICCTSGASKHWFTNILRALFGLWILCGWWSLCGCGPVGWNETDPTKFQSVASLPGKPFAYIYQNVKHTDSVNTKSRKAQCHYDLYNDISGTEAGNKHSCTKRISVNLQ